MSIAKYLASKEPIFVAGGSRGVGLEVIRQLSNLGNPVHALVRSIEAENILKSQFSNVRVIVGDAYNEAAVQEAMNGCIAAVTTLGGLPSGGHKERIDYVGNSNVVEQAGILGVERIILVTSVGCGNTKGAIPEAVFETLEGALTAKNKAERDLKTYTNLDWTILRPGGLKNDPPTGKAIFTEDIRASGAVTRADVAAKIIEALGSKGKLTRKEVTVVDPTFSPEYHYIPLHL